MDIKCNKIKTQHKEGESKESLNEEHVYGTQTDDNELWIKEESDEENNFFVEINQGKVTNVDTENLEPPSNTKDLFKQELESDVDTNILVEIKDDEDINVVTPEFKSPSNIEDDKEVWIQLDLEPDEDDNVLVSTKHEELTNMEIPKLEPPSNTEDGTSSIRLEVAKYIQSVIINEEERQIEHPEVLSALQHMPYTCEPCALGFVVEDVYMMHMEVHSPEAGDFECDICHSRLKSADILYRHRLWHYRRYRCGICSKLHRDKDAATHHVMTDHTFACIHCGKGFTKLLETNCPECHREVTPAALLEHMKPADKTEKEFRARQKFLGALKSVADDKSAIIFKKKSSKQRSREYRARKKLLLESESAADNQSALKLRIKTSTERSREYRARQKLLRASGSVASQQSAIKEKKASAERGRKYRERQKLLKQLELSKRKQRKKKSTSKSRVAQFRQRALIKKLPSITTTPNTSRRKSRISYINNDFIEESYQGFLDYDVIEDLESSQSDIAFNDDMETKMEVDEEINTNNDTYTQDSNIEIYTHYYLHDKAHINFFNQFTNNTFGHSCAVCDRLWWEKDMKMTSKVHEHLFQIILPNYVIGTNVQVCTTCKVALDRQKIPIFSTYNGFYYPKIPRRLPKLDLISLRLISPRVPFFQIRRLRHVHGQNSIYGQIINVPLKVNTMVNKLPRCIDDDHCFYVDIKKKLIHTTSELQGLVNKKHIREWLEYLVETPMYIHHDISIDEDFFDSDAPDVNIEEFSEPIDDNLSAQQQTLTWNEDMFLHMAPGKHVPVSIWCDEFAEELSFPAIYGGQFRIYHEAIHVTPFMQASSELRRTDRRGVDPEHLLYMAMKVMRQRVKDSVRIAFKHSDIKEKGSGNTNSCIETNLAFLRCIPNSPWYWSDKQKDLFSMIRQKGAPTAFMTLSANETGWDDLLKLLYKLKKSGEDISDEALADMCYVQKAQLVNEDSVTCVIYFDKIVNCLINILQSKTHSPFGEYRVLHYYKRLEFQHRGSPRAHILLWLDNAPAKFNNDVESIRMIDELVSVATSEASGNIKLQSHKHTDNCYKKDINKQNCRFGAPFMPARQTVTLFPIKDNDDNYSDETIKKYKDHYKKIRTNLENDDYTDFEQFYAHNNIESDEQYYNIIRAVINRPTVFYKREPSEKWHNTFNPFILHHLKSSMEFHIIQDEYSCATYVSQYVNKSNRGISNLQRQIVEIINEHPEFDIVEMTSRISVDILHAIEMSAQEAAWYLLREPMTKSSIVTAYIPTVYPAERQRIRLTLAELNALDDDCTNICKETWFDKYEKRPANLENVTLAQFVAKYCRNSKGKYAKRTEVKVIRYRNYDISEFNDYRREMVLLHIPFRSEDNDVLADNKFIQMFEDNKDLILERQKEFESKDIQNTLEMCRQLCTEEENEDGELRNEAHILFEADPYQQLLHDSLSDSAVDADMQ